MFVPRIRPFAHEILPLLPIEPTSSAEMADHDGETSSDIREPFNKTLLHLAQPGQSCTDDDGKPLIVLDQRQEARLRRKMDLHIVPVISIMYMFCFLDRVNLGNAKIAGLEKDLGLGKFDYNFLIMATYVPYAVLEPPITLLIKKVGPGRIIPVLCVLFGVVTLTFAFVTDFTGAIVNRVFLGLFEASIIPGLSYYLSRWYRRTEVTIRITCFLASGSMSGAVGGLLASAILTENAIGSIKGWRMIFLIEGLITIIIGLLAVYLMPDSIETAGWLSEREKALALVRLKSERVACLGVVDAMRKKLTRQGMLLPHAYLLGVAQMIPSLTAQAAGFMLPTLVKIIFHAKTVPQQQLLSAPPYFVGSLLTLLVAYLSTKHARFGVFILGNYLFAIIGCSILVATTTGQPRLRYAALFLCVPAAFIAGECNGSA